ncbi:DUF6695 family protein [Portibacter lacus]|uniref:Uncharacterized protein n=1 Tax=Portibacter lacus TaxID=1099794 RepID=A0AA37WHG4_9BACT|nr:DUF6695 family protein [Portibacter lacus]GLR19304.1 hypothetical protein GCM10007940_39200 [Portibacter lacus]
MNKPDALIALAFPEEFVSMIPAWYKKPLEWIGMINNDMVCAGHAALAIVHGDSGEIEYADFGRYITPFGKGRTRTVLTDPECKIDIKAEFTADGKIKNEEEILLYLEAHPEKTHGAGKMYASFCYNIDYNKAKSFIKDINLKGSVIYDPFKKDASNCARFVYDTFKAGIRSKRRRAKLKLWNQVTPSPLGIVFNGTDQKRVYSVLDGNLEHYEGSKFTSVIKHLFLKPDPNDITTFKKVDLDDSHHWLDGVGASGWFKLSKPNGKYIFERRFPDGRKIFEEEFYSESEHFDIEKPFELIHDCNALWCTAKQDGIIFKLYNYNYKELA